MPHSSLCSGYIIYSLPPCRGEWSHLVQGPVHAHTVPLPPRLLQLPLQLLQPPLRLLELPLGLLQLLRLSLAATLRRRGKPPTSPTLTGIPTPDPEAQSRAAGPS